MSTARTIRLVDPANGPERGRFLPEADNRTDDGTHAVSRRSAPAFSEHPSQPDGLLCHSRHAPERLAISRFDRLAHDRTAQEGVLALQDRERVAAMRHGLCVALRGEARRRMALTRERSAHRHGCSDEGVVHGGVTAVHERRRFFVHVFRI